MCDVDTTTIEILLRRLIATEERTQMLILEAIAPRTGAIADNSAPDKFTEAAHDEWREQR